MGEYDLVEITPFDIFLFAAVIFAAGFFIGLAC